MKKTVSFLASAIVSGLLLSACTATSPYQTTTQSDIDALCNAASFDMPTVPVPTFPDRTFSVLMGEDVAPRRDFIEAHATYANIDA